MQFFPANFQQGPYGNHRFQTPFSSAAAWQSIRDTNAVSQLTAVVVSGKKEVTAVKLNPEVVDPDDIEMLQDLIVAATNEALRQMEAASQEVMNSLAGGLGGGLGGGFPF